MHIFIDESGTFTRAAAAASISAVGALIIPEGQLPRIEQKYRRLRQNLPQVKGEVKGRLLSEPEVSRIASMLYKNQVIFEISVMDLSLSSEEETKAHQAAQAEKLTANLTNEHNAAASDFVHDLRARLERIPPQLYVQSVVTFQVIARVLKHATLYHSQRQPRELAAFHWVVDAKEPSGVIDWEDWWSSMVSPYLQSYSLRNPLPMLEGADYSYFERFDRDAPDYLVPILARERQGPMTDIGMIMRESFRFSSEPELGLELVDIMTNATRRALLGNLGQDGWGEIRRLMIHTRDQYIQLLSMGRTDAIPSYAQTINDFRSGGRPLLTPRRQLDPN